MAKFDKLINDDPLRDAVYNGFALQLIEDINTFESENPDEKVYLLVDIGFYRFLKKIYPNILFFNLFRLDMDETLKDEGNYYKIFTYGEVRGFNNG